MADLSSRAGTVYFDEPTLDYVSRVHVSHDAALEQAFSAPNRTGMPAIMVSPSDGKLLGLFLRMIGAKKVVELGTLAGYSAIQMARALPDDGHVFTIEYDPKHAAVARENIEAAGLASKITVHVGAGLDVLPTLEKEGPFDAVFIDADKGNYDHYGRWAAKNVRKGGLLLGDNTFLFGRLLEDSAEAAAMRRFHEEAALAFDTVCIINPDGTLLGIKK